MTYQYSNDNQVFKKPDECVDCPRMLMQVSQGEGGLEYESGVCDMEGQGALVVDSSRATAIGRRERVVDAGHWSATASAWTKYELVLRTDSGTQETVVTPTPRRCVCGRRSERSSQ